MEDSRRSPRITETDGEKPNEHDSCPACRGRRSTPSIGIPLFLELTNDTSYNEMADSHDDGARNKNGLSAPAVQINDGRNGGKEHDDADNARCQKRCGVTSEIKTGEDERGVIQDEVDTCNQRL
jgi:hypothetical protein